ncbi:hypothetical protein [Nocardioides aurantiacus]|uniref:DUF2336 domain-containing protein n=1 Tax=Nocardioides aurantiacus TaxID=86796 RepID=A0A3N2CTA0_9ACTN|nr:hypothetical protein [Nocardioides aurantiacus]ROR90770.1 hypothetical protein EDD33_1618 [Nocardioides aurantiacus]
MTDPETDPAALADRLLDAQVAWALGELTGERFAAVVAEDVDRVLEVAATLRLGDVVAHDDLVAVAQRLARDVVTSPVVLGLTEPEAGEVHRTLLAEEATLGEVVDRADVEALVQRVVAMHDVRDRVLDGLVESPATAQLTARLVSRIVTDVLTQQRSRAEKVPGVSSLLSLGSGAVSRVGKVGVGDYQLDKLLGDAVGAGAQFTMRRTTAIVREVVTDAVLQEVALELFDLQAGTPVGELVAVVEEEDVVDLATRGRAVLDGLLDRGAGAALADRLVGATVARFLDEHATTDLATLLDDLGVGRDHLVELVRTLAPPVLAAARESGVLEHAVRERLAPFWSSAEVRAVLGAAGGPA